MKKRNSRGLAWLVLFIGVAILAACSIPVVRTILSNRWPAVPCTIVSSRMVVTSRGWSPEIRYRYTAGTSTHESARYDFGSPIRGTTYRIQQLLDRYPAGSSQTCYADPRHPASVVLTRTLRFPIGGVVVSLFFLATGGAMLFEKQLLAWMEGRRAPTRMRAS